MGGGGGGGGGVCVEIFQFKPEKRTFRLAMKLPGPVPFTTYCSLLKF